MSAHLASLHAAMNNMSKIVWLARLSILCQALWFFYTGSFVVQHDHITFHTRISNGNKRHLLVPAVTSCSFSAVDMPDSLASLLFFVFSQKCKWLSLNHIYGRTQKSQTQWLLYGFLPENMRSLCNRHGHIYVSQTLLHWQRSKAMTKKHTRYCFANTKMERRKSSFHMCNGRTTTCSASQNNAIRQTTITFKNGHCVCSQRNGQPFSQQPGQVH